MNTQPSIPWNADDMTLPQLRDELTRMDRRTSWSNSDLWRRSHVARRIVELEQIELHCQPLLDREKVAFGRQMFAGGRGR